MITPLTARDLTMRGVGICNLKGTSTWSYPGL